MNWYYGLENETLGNEKYILRANDKKAIIKSGSLSLIRKDEEEEEEVGLTIKTNDKKSLLKSKSFEINLPMDDIVVKLETKDKKSFVESKNIYFYIREGDYLTYEMEIKNSTLKVMYKLHQDSIPYSLFLEGLEDIPERITTIEATVAVKKSVDFEKFLDTKNAVKITESELENKISSLIKEKRD